MTDFYYADDTWLGSALPGEDIEQRRRELAFAYGVDAALVRAVRR